MAGVGFTSGVPVFTIFSERTLTGKMPEGHKNQTMSAEEDHEQAEGYDEAARATGWQGPSLVFSLMHKAVRPDQTLLDIGIGTGLGSDPFSAAGLRITGMDRSATMLNACQRKGITTRLVRHDLTEFPYPFGDMSFDHVISTGVFQFFQDLDPVFREVARILHEGGRFAFVTGDRRGDEPFAIVSGPEQTGTGASVTIYSHSPDQVTGWLEKNGFIPENTVQFTIWMDEEQSRQFPARAYVARKRG